MGQTGNAGKTIVYVILPKWVEAYRHGVCCPLRGLVQSSPDKLQFKNDMLQASDVSNWEERRAGTPQPRWAE